MKWTDEDFMRFGSLIQNSQSFVLLSSHSEMFVIAGEKKMSDPFSAFIARLEKDRSEAAILEQHRITPESHANSQDHRVLLFSTDTPVLSGWKISESLPMVTAHDVLGVSNPNAHPLAIFQSLESRSNPFMQAMADLENCLCEQLRSQASAMECQAVVGVRITFGELTGTAHSLYLFGTAQGTPIRLRKVEEQQASTPAAPELAECT